MHLVKKQTKKPQHINNQAYYQKRQVRNIINIDSPTFSGSDTPISISKTSPFVSSSI